MAIIPRPSISGVPAVGRTSPTAAITPSTMWMSATARGRSGSSTLARRITSSSFIRPCPAFLALGGAARLVLGEQVGVGVTRHVGMGVEQGLVDVDAEARTGRRRDRPTLQVDQRQARVVADVGDHRLVRVDVVLAQPHPRRRRPVQVRRQPHDRRAADVRDHLDRMALGDVDDAQTVEDPAGQRRIGLEHAGRVAAGQFRERGRGVDPLADGDPDRRGVLHPLEPVEAVLRDRLLEEVDAQRGDLAGEFDRRVGIVEPVRVDTDQHLRADVLTDRADHLHVVGDVAPEAHLHPGEAERHALVEVVSVPVGRLLEHRRAGAVQGDRVGAAAEQLMDGDAEVFAEDVPQRDLDRPEGLARRPLGAEVAVEHDAEVGHPVADRQRITSDEVAGAHVVDDRPEHRRIRMAPVGRRLAPAHRAVVGLDAHQREAPLHRRIALAIAGEASADVDDPHGIVLVARAQRDSYD